MKHMETKIAACLIGILLLISGGLLYVARERIAGLAGPADNHETEYQYHFSLVTEEDDNPYWDLVYQGAKEEAELNSAYLEMTGRNLSEHYTLAQRFRMASASQVDGIIVTSDGSSELNRLMKDAVGGALLKSIPVLSVMEDNSDAARSGYVGINSYEQGQKYGELLVRLYEEQGISRVALLSNAMHKENNAGLYYGDMIYSSIVEYLQTRNLSDKIQVTVQNVNHASPFNCRRDIQILLNREEKPEVLICTDYLYTLSACQVLVDKNLVGDVFVLGSYLSDEILNYIQKGTLYAVAAADPYDLGKTCIQTLMELEEYGRANEYQTIDMMIITSENVSEYQKLYSGEEES